MQRVGIKVDADTLSASKNLKQLNNALGDTKNAVKRADTASGQFIKMQKNIKGLVSTYAALGAGVMATGAAVWTSVKAYAESEKVQVNLERAINNTGMSYSKWDEQVQKLIASQSDLAAVDDELVSQSLTKLVQMTGDVNQAMKLNAIALDVSRATGKDLISTATVIGKVYAGNVGALKRYGITVREGATATEALGEIQKKYRGAAEDYGKTTAGAADRMATAYGNALEAGGRFSVEVLKLDKYMNRSAEGMNAMANGELKSWGEVIRSSVDPVHSLTNFYKTYTSEVDKSAGKLDALTQSQDKNATAATDAMRAQQGYTAALIEQQTAQDSLLDKELSALRAEQAVKDSKKNLKEVVKQYGKNSDEARIATLELEKAQRDATTASSNFADAQRDVKDATRRATANMTELKKKVDAIKRSANLAAGALDKMYGAGAGDASRASASYGGRQDRAYGGIEKARPGGVTVRVAEAGSDEAIIPINTRARSYALLGETMRRMGLPQSGQSIVVNASGSRADAQYIEVAVKNALRSVLGD
jgi:chromosome segregation ATPase